MNDPMAPHGSFAQPGLAKIGEMLEQLADLVRHQAVDAGPVDGLRGPGTGEILDITMVNTTIAMRQERESLFPTEWFSDPAWDVLLFIYQSHLKDEQITVGDVGHGARIRQTTAIRWLDVISCAGLIDRTRSLDDSRRVFVTLTQSGLVAIRSYFAYIRSVLIMAPI